VSRRTTAPGRLRRRRARTRNPIGRPRAVDRPPGFTREQLLKAAADVFAEQGFERASLQTIAARAGVTSAAIYRHFASKADLLLGVIEQAIHALPLAERLDRGEVLAAAELARMVSLYADPARATLRRLAIEIHAAASRQPDAAALLLRFNERIHRSLSAKLAQSVAAGRLPESLDADRAASLLVVMIMGLAHLETLAPTLIGDTTWIRYLESSLGDLLGKSSARRASPGDRTPRRITRPRARSSG
jgi:AcrR family transcriptional regulator